MKSKMKLKKLVSSIANSGKRRKNFMKLHFAHQQQLQQMTKKIRIMGDNNTTFAFIRKPGIKTFVFIQPLRKLVGWKMKVRFGRTRIYLFRMARCIKFVLMGKYVKLNSFRFRSICDNSFPFCFLLLSLTLTA